MLELNMEVVKARAPVMDISPEDVTADRFFDEGYAAWVGITPDDHQRREQERNEIQKLAKTDLLAYIQAMKEWGPSRAKLNVLKLAQYTIVYWLTLNSSKKMLDIISFDYTILN